VIPGSSLPQGAATHLPRLRSPHCSPEMRVPGTDRRKRSVFVRAPQRRKRHRACSLCALAPSRLRAKRNAPSQFAKCPTSLVAGDGFASALWNRTWRSGRQSTELFDSQSAESGPANAHTLRTKPAGRRLRPDLPLHCGIERAAADGSPWRCSDLPRFFGPGVSAELPLLDQGLGLIGSGGRRPPGSSRRDSSEVALRCTRVATARYGHGLRHDCETIPC